MLAGVVIAVLASLAAGERESGSLIRGDFPAFYSAAVILKANKAGSLYDPRLQREIQNRFWPSLGGKYAAFAYPPFVAFMLRPLAGLSPGAAKLCYLAVSALCLLSAFLLAERFITGLAKNRLFGITAIAAFAPLTSGFFAGQNIALSLMLYASILAIGLSEHRHWPFACGFLAGLWFFKPHFGAIALGLLLVCGGRRVLLGALIPVVVYYCIGASLLGWSWFEIWFEQAREFSRLDALANGHQMISLFGVSEALSRALALQTWAALLLKLISLLLSAALLVSVCFFSGCLKTRTGPASRAIVLLLMGPAIVLCSPHILYYDLALCMLPLAVVLPIRSDRAVTAIVLLLLASNLLVLSRSAFALSPFIIFSAGSFFLTAKKLLDCPWQKDASEGADIS